MSAVNETVELDGSPFLLDWKAEHASPSRMHWLLVGLDHAPLKGDPLVVELLQTRSKLQRAFLHVNMLMPTLTMIVCLYGIGSIWLAAIAFHAISCVIVPVAYIVACAGTDGLAKLCSSLHLNLRTQLAWGAVFFVVGGMVGLAGYGLVVRKIVPSNRDAVVDLGLSEDPSTLGLFGLYFSVVNPVVEEIFWRGGASPPIARRPHAGDLASPSTVPREEALVRLLKLPRTH